MIPSRPVKVLVDYPTISDTKRDSPFTSGMYHDFRKWMEQSGFDINQVEFLYVHRDHPPGNEPDNWFCTKTQYISRGFKPFCGTYIHPAVHASILAVREKLEGTELVIAAGDIALMAVYGEQSVLKWRGSQLFRDSTRIVPIISPASAARKHEWTFLIRHDLSRAYRFWAERELPPAEHFVINPTFSEAILWLTHAANVPRRHIGVDIETRFGYITYISVATNPNRAICIPFVKADSVTSYWSEAEELQIILALRRVTYAHLCVGQNFTYDLQYLARHWGLNIRDWKDTMIAWHLLHPGLKKSIDFICSMSLPYYVFWKEEGKGHLPNSAEVDTYQRYNCKDAGNTLQAWHIMEESFTLVQAELVNEQHETAYAMYKMMLRGVRQDLAERRRQLIAAMQLRMEVEGRLIPYTDALVGDHKLTKGKSKSNWWQSPTQLATILYTIFRLPAQKSRTTRRVSTDDDCLNALGEIEPLFKPIFQLILEHRSLNVFISTFLNVKLDWDDRMRCSYGVGMAETFRCTSSTDAFGYGGNLQNIPSGNELED